MENDYDNVSEDNDDENDTDIDVLDEDDMDEASTIGSPTLIMSPSPHSSPSVSRPPSPLTDDNVFIQKMRKLIECPVCLEFLRPGTKKVGLCINGHLLCYVCIKKLWNEKRKGCPVCRTETLNVECHNYLANSVIEIVSDSTAYTCQHDKCFVRLVGKAITEHEKMCELKPLKCPKKDCEYAGPYKTYIDRQHTCLSMLEATLENGYKKVWQFTINFEDIFSFDYNKERISGAFKPILLLPPPAEGAAAENNHEKIYVNVRLINQCMGILLHISPLETMDDLSSVMKQKKYIMSAQVHSYVGKVGSVSRVSLASEKTLTNSHSHGTYMSHGNIITHIKLFLVNGCQTCPNRVPHFHVNIKECAIDV